MEVTNFFLLSLLFEFPGPVRFLPAKYEEDKVWMKHRNWWTLRELEEELEKRKIKFERREAKLEEEADEEGLTITVSQDEVEHLLKEEHPYLHP